MRPPDDAELLTAYTARHSEDAFTELVGRHVGLVYSAALRQVGEPALAEEVTQAVFLLLARKARTVSRHPSLAGWLCRVAHFVARDALRTERRRRHREQIAVPVEPAPETDWRHIAPLLDEVVAQLNDRDRSAIVLRFYEQKSLGEVATALGVDADAAQKRVSRALEKLRKFFARRGVTSTSATIAAAVSAHSVQAAPAGLAHTISTAALAKGAAAGGSTLSLVKGALKLMAWTKAKMAVVVGASVLLAAGTTTVTVEQIHEHQNDAWRLGQMNTTFLYKLRHQTTILPAKIKSSAHGMAWFENGQVMGYNQPMEFMVRAAAIQNGMVGQYRTLLATDFPTNKYDFISNLPTGSKAALARELRRKFQVASRFETLETNVLFLKVKNANAAGLKPTTVEVASSSAGNGVITEEDCIMDELAHQLENLCALPVINQTGLTNRYDFKIRWREGERFGGNDPDYQNVPGLKQALTEQLGLELVPGTAPVEMLVVEKVK